MSVILENEHSAQALLETIGSVPLAGIELQLRSFTLPGVDIFERPIIILGAPRSGTTLLFESLALCRNAWTVGGESHPIFEGADPFPLARGHRMDESDATAELMAASKAYIVSLLRNRNADVFLSLDDRIRPDRVRFLEKTPKNSLRVPFLRKLFPDCRFIFIYREPRGNIASLISSWHTRSDAAYDLNGYSWRFLLPPGWKTLVGKPIPEICAAQWMAANQQILNDLAVLPRADWCAVDYDRLTGRSSDEVLRLYAFAEFEPDEQVASLLKSPLPLSGGTLTPPHPDKWRQHQNAINRVLPSVQGTWRRLESAAVG